MKQSTRSAGVPRASFPRALIAGAALLLLCGLGCRSHPRSDKSPVEANPSEAKPGEAKPGQAKPGEAKPAPKSDTATPPSTSNGPESVDGYQLIRARTKGGELSSLRVKAPQGWEVVQPPSQPDPHNGTFTLAEATKGLDKKGTLAAQIETSMGSFYCDLFADKTPNTVANFVGLARGLRKFWDQDKLVWTARPYYDGTSFHRVIPGFMIQGGDPTGTGKGRIGYTIPDEVTPDQHHDQPGQLCMANRGKNTNEAQFFITEAGASRLDGSYTIFGQCEPATLVQRIARVPQSGAPNNAPLTIVKIEHVKIKKLEGGAAKWMPNSARLPPMPGVPPPGRAVQVPAPAAPKR